MTARHSDIARALSAAILKASPWVELASGNVMCRWCHAETRKATVAPEHTRDCPITIASEYRAGDEMLRCPRCEQTKHLTEFPRDRTRHRGRCAYCRPCKQQANKEYARAS